MRAKNSREAVEEAARLLLERLAKERDNTKLIVDCINISRLTIAQLQMFDLIHNMGLNRFQVAAYIDVSERAPRSWRDADHCPKRENARKLDALWRSEVSKNKKANKVKADITRSRSQQETSSSSNLQAHCVVVQTSPRNDAMTQATSHHRLPRLASTSHRRAWARQRTTRQNVAPKLSPCVLLKIKNI